MLKYENEFGLIAVDDSVICSIVANTASKCFGVAGMAAKNVTEHIWAFLKKDVHDKGIQVSCIDNEVVINMHIMVSYGINIPAITDSIVHKIAYNVSQALNCKVRKVNVFVDSITNK